MAVNTVTSQYSSLITLFAELYKYPDEAIMEELKNGAIDNEMIRAFISCNIPVMSMLELKQLSSERHPLKQQFMKAFSGVNKPFYPPVESLYKPWSTAPGTPKQLAGKKGYYMGDCALHMKHLLRHYDLNVPEDFDKMPDHLTIELEFYSFLLDKDSQAAVIFHKEHLDWLHDFEKDIMKLNDIPFYQEVTSRLRRVLAIRPETLLGEE